MLNQTYLIIFEPLNLGIAIGDFTFESCQCVGLQCILLLQFTVEEPIRVFHCDIHESLITFHHTAVLAFRFGFRSNDLKDASVLSPLQLDLSGNVL